MTKIKKALETMKTMKTTRLLQWCRDHPNTSAAENVEFYLPDLVNDDPALILIGILSIVNEIEHCSDSFVEKFVDPRDRAKVKELLYSKK